MRTIAPTRHMIRLAAAAVLLLVIGRPASAQVRINEVGYESVDFQSASQWVELYNEGASPADVSTMYLCRFPDYPSIGSLNVLSGSTTIPSNGYLVVEFTSLLIGDGEVGLYANNSGFGVAANIRDYVEYGSTGHTRSPTAVSAGVWASGNFVPSAGPDQSLSYVGGPTGAAAWASTLPTPGAENGGPVGVDQFNSNKRLLAVLDSYPNPVRDGDLTIRFRVTETSSIAVEVFDLLGRRRISTSIFAVGNPQGSTVALNVRDLPTGNYLYRLSTSSGGESSRSTGSFVVIER